MTRFLQVAAFVSIFSHFSLSAQTLQLSWAAQIGGEASQNIADMHVTGEGSILVTGTFGGATDFDPGQGTTELTPSGSNDVFLAKYTDAGILLWVKRIGGTNSEGVNDLQTDADGNVYLTGQYQGTPDMDPGQGTSLLLNFGLIDCFLAKYDADGNYLWAKGIGGGFNEAGNALAVDASGNVCLTGYFADTLDLNPGPFVFPVTSKGMTDVFIACYDSQGAFLWGKSFGGSQEDAGSDLQIGPGNVFHVGGTFSDTIDIDPGAGVKTVWSNGQRDVFYLRLGADGAYQTDFTLGGSGDEGLFDIALGPNNAFYLAGTFNDTVDFDPGGNVHLLPSDGSNNAFLAAYDSNAGFLWARNNGRGVTRRVATDAWGRLITVGDFSGSINLGPGGEHTSTGMNDILLARFDGNGNYQSSLTFGSTGIDVGRCVAGLPGGKLLYAAEFRNTMDVDPGPADLTFIANGVDGLLSELRLCEPVTIMSDATICEGETYVFPDGTLGTTSTVHQSVFTTSLGCDSTIITSLLVLPGDSTFWSGTTCDSAFAGQIISVYANINGCDSVVVYTTTYVPIEAGLINMGALFIATPDGAQYQWINVSEGGIPVPGATSQEFTTYIDGCYAVIVTLSSCSDTSECEYILTPGTGEPAWASSLSIAPNPWASGNLHLSWPAEVQITSVELVDAKGRVLERRFPTGTSLFWENDALPTGMYFMRFRATDGSEVWRKVVKE